MSKGVNYVDVECILRNRTRLALCVDSDEWDEEIWVPIAATDGGDEFNLDDYEDEIITLRVEERLARQKGMI